MLPVLRSHQEYLEFAQKHLPKTTIPKAHADVVEKLRLLAIVQRMFSAALRL